MGRLIDRFQPSVLYGFDPQSQDGQARIRGTLVVVSSAAAWIHDGAVQFEGENLGAHIVQEFGGVEVKCIDLAAFIVSLVHWPVLKLDCEGAEYAIVEKLLAEEVGLERLLVEWHCPECKHGIWSHAESCDQLDEAEALVRRYEAMLPFPFERWDM